MVQEAELEGRLKAARFELEAKRAEKKALVHFAARRSEENDQGRSQMRKLRGEGGA